MARVVGREFVELGVEGGDGTEARRRAFCKRISRIKRPKWTWEKRQSWHSSRGHCSCYVLCEWCPLDCVTVGSKGVIFGEQLEEHLSWRRGFVERICVRIKASIEQILEAIKYQNKMFKLYPTVDLNVTEEF